MSNLVNYHTNNFCRTCKIIYPKSSTHCTDRNGCGMKVATKPRHRNASEFTVPRKRVA